MLYCAGLAIFSYPYRLPNLEFIFYYLMMAYIFMGIQSILYSVCLEMFRKTVKKYLERDSIILHLLSGTGLGLIAGSTMLIIPLDRHLIFLAASIPGAFIGAITALALWTIKDPSEPDELSNG